MCGVTRSSSSPSCSLPRGGLVHRHGEAELEVFVQHLAPQGNPLAKHLHGHEAECLPVHQEPVALDGGQPVDVGHVADPNLDVFAHPGAGI